MIHVYYCTLCKETNKESLHKHYKYTLKNGEEKQKYICKVCSKNKFKKWYSENPDRFKEIVKKSIGKYPEKTIARTILNYAVKKGMVNKPDECQHCKQHSKRIEGHHTDYEKPLTVLWLCSSCHHKQH